MKVLLASITMLLFTPYLGAQTIEPLLQSALAEDAEYQRLLVQQERLELQYERADYSPPLSLSLGSATATSLSLRTDGGVEPGGDPDQALSLQLTPRASVGLGDHHDVSVQATVDGTTEQISVMPSVNYGWNPGPVGETGADRLQDLERMDARLSASEALTARASVIGQQVRAALRSLVQAQRQRNQAESAVDAAQEALSDADALGSPSPQSADYLQLQQGLTQATRSLDLRNRAVADSLRDLEQLTGVSLQRSVAELVGTERFPVLEGVPESGLNSQTHAAALRRLELARARLAEQAGENGTDPPGFSASARWSLTPATEFSDLRQQIGGGIGLQWEQVAVGLDTELALGGDEVPTTTRLTVQWQLPDQGAEALDLSLERASAEISELTYQQALEQLRDERESLLRDRRNLEDAILRYTEDLMLLDLRITEARRRVDRGLAATSLLENLEEQRQLMEYDRVLLQLDIMDYNAQARRLAGEEGPE